MAETWQPNSRLKAAVLWGLLGCSGVLLAADTELPDVEFDPALQPTIAMKKNELRKNPGIAASMAK